MIVEPIGVLVALAGLFTIAIGLNWGAYLVCISTLLGAAAAIILPALGGANIQPVHLVLVFLVAAAALRPKTLAACLSCFNYPGPGFWFALFVLYSVVTAFFLPRIFAGATIVYSLTRDNDMHRILATPLAPGTSNFTQAVYMLGGLACFAVIGGFSRLGGATIVARALAVTASICLAFAIIDLATFLTNAPDILSVIRNANYRMLSDGEILGFKRIVGSFPEAGAYGYVALALFAFVLVLWLERFPHRFLGLVAAALAVTLVLSTSTTAYAASAATSVIIFIFCIARILRRRASSRHIVYIAGCLLAVPLFVAAATLVEPVRESISGLLHATITTKLESQSGEERMRWNAQALTSFLDTSGLGAGLGSVRASSFVVALAANVGIPGLLIYAVFIVSLIRSVLRREPDGGLDATIGLAALFSCGAQVTAASLSAGAIDLGPLFSITAGLAVARALGPMESRAAGGGEDMRWLGLPGTGFQEALAGYRPSSPSRPRRTARPPLGYGDPEAFASRHGSE